MFMTSNRCTAVQNTLDRSAVVSSEGQLILLRETSLCILFYLARDAHKFVSRLLINWISNTWWPLVSDRELCFWQEMYFSCSSFPRSQGHPTTLKAKPESLGNHQYIYIYRYALLPYWLMLAYKQRFKHNGQAYLCSTCIPNFACLDPIIHYLSLSYRKLTRQEKYAQRSISHRSYHSILDSSDGPLWSQMLLLTFCT